MKTRMLLMLLLAALWCPVPGLVSSLAEKQVQAATAGRRSAVRLAEDSCESRERASSNLESFEGGRQGIIATDDDVHLLVAILVVTAVVLVLILL